MFELINEPPTSPEQHAEFLRWHAEFLRWSAGFDVPNDIGYWYPRLAATGVRTPRTILVKPEFSLWDVIDATGNIEDYQKFVAQIEAAISEVGRPAFMRAGHSSGKHDYLRTCYVGEESDVRNNIYSLCEFAGYVDIPFGTFAVREFLTLDSTFVAFHGLPVNRERRYFIRDGKVICHHPYWPEHSIEGHTKQENWEELLAGLNEETNEEVTHLTEMSEIVSRAMPEAWSLDWARTKDGTWYAIDMAKTGTSFHWPDCETQN